MRARKLKRFWICRHGHPMWRKPVSGHWICYTCNDMNLRAYRTGFCVHGHKRVIGKDCSTCKAYTLTPWLKELDEKGEAVCPNGHEVSHYNDSVSYRKTNRFRSRHCRQCQFESILRMRANPHDFVGDPMCRSKLHVRTEENTLVIRGVRQCKPCWEARNAESVMRQQVKKQRQRTLKASYVDWVVVERLLAKGGQLDYIRRGRTLGPTDGERWVAYCTFRANHGGKHPEELYGEPGLDAIRLWKMSAWRRLGTKHRWREFTLYDLMSIIHTEEYVTGGFLHRYKKRESPR